MLSSSRSVVIAAMMIGVLALAAGHIVGPFDPALAYAHHSPGHGGGPGGGETPPPPPALDGGTIYYFGYDSGARTMFVTSPDGAISADVPGAPVDYDAPTPGSGSIGVPSEELHDGDRWYLAHSFIDGDAIFPGSRQDVSLEVDVIREGIADVSTTDNRGNCVQVYGQVKWAPDSSGAPDAAASWVGAQWADNDGDPNGVCETFEQAGVFRAALQYTGNVITGIGVPTLDTVVPVDSANLVPDVKNFAWSPDGSSVAYIGAGGLWVAGSGSALSSHSLLFEGNFFDIDWSPDQDPDTAGYQTTIAFTGWEYVGKISGGVWVLSPDGSGLALLAEAKQAKRSGQTSYTHISPFWSPGGQQVAYIERATNGVLDAGSYSIRRMNADGSNNEVILTEASPVEFRSLREWASGDLSP